MSNDLTTAAGPTPAARPDRASPLRFAAWFAYVLAVGDVLLQFIRCNLTPALETPCRSCLRTDNFFSFSSGHVRRALCGEIMYRLDLAGLPGPFLYALLLALVFLLSYGVLLPACLRKDRPAALVLIALSPLLPLWLFDREILVLVPMLYLFARRRTDLPFFLLIAVLAFAHESVLLFYSVFLVQPLYLAIRHRSARNLVRILPVLAAGLVFLLVPARVSHVLELTYWPSRGFPGLQESWLYRFAGNPLGKTISLHLGWLLSVRGLVEWTAVLVFFLLVIATLNRDRMRPAETLWLLAVNTGFFVLTVDYGRYIPVLFAFYTAYSLYAPPLTSNAPSQDGPGGAGRLRLAAAAVASFTVRHRTALLVLLALAVLGPWVTEPDPAPAFYTRVSSWVSRAGEVLRRIGLPLPI